MSKSFSEEIQKFHLMLESKHPFALSRFGDGEMMAMRGDTLASGYGEWMTNGENPRYTLVRRWLKESFTYKHSNYHVGIVCPCCQGQAAFERMRDESGQVESNLTFANVFVNSNYNYFVSNIVPLFASRSIHLVAHEEAQVNRLPFKGQFYPVTRNAWIESIDLVNHLEHLVIDSVSDSLFLFAAGPLSKILCHRLWNLNKTNTYLDIGSTLHPWIKTDLNIRGYYSGGADSHKVCVWG